MKAPLLEGVSLRKRFGSMLALDGADFACAAGQIHALLGENGAGKSTLVHLLCALHRPDSGEIRLDGAPVYWRSPEQARAAGISLVHQHFMLVPSLTVAENVALARGTVGAFAPARLEEEVLRVAAARRIDVRAPDRLVAELSVGEQQRVEILKALVGPSRILILDEPTAVLTPGEVDDLFDLLREIARQGSAVIIVTHKLGEVLAIADTVTVLREGRVRATGPVSELDAQKLVTLMVPGGVATSSRAPGESPEKRSEATPLVARRLRAHDRRGVRMLDDISLSVRSGEILGIAGVEGNGQAELVAALVGAFDGEIDGEVLIDGRIVKEPVDSRAAGLALIPPDRHREGLVVELSVFENLLLRVDLLAAATPRGVVDQDGMALRAAGVLAEFDVRPPAPAAPAASLSGGNQQRLVIARELGLTRPKVVVAANPTRGLDVVATAFVQRRLRDVADSGAAVLLISSDLDEVETLADEIAVLYRGRLHGPFPAPMDRRVIGSLMASGEIQA
jgi:simple sugar transport system ATP-binding protein